MNENMRNFCIILLSLPVWERGLKCSKLCTGQRRGCVAPRVGAWIEICHMAALPTGSLSLPVWERGLKYVTNRMIERDNVAPRVGAWIEMKKARRDYNLGVVAPRVGAWIEIYVDDNGHGTAMVAPRVGAWIEIIFVHTKSGRKSSLPVWERGLK